MTAKATAAPPGKPSPTTVDDEFRRYTPAEVIERGWLPYTSPRVLREKAYKRQVIHHNDGGKITFTLEDIRRENERTTVPTAA